MSEFTLTQDHLKLFARMYVRWDDSYSEGAPAIGLKRPYGNSDVLGDLAECPPTPRGGGRPFQAIVTSLDARDHPYKGPVKSIIRRIEQ